MIFGRVLKWSKTDAAEPDRFYFIIPYIIFHTLVSLPLETQKNDLSWQDYCQRSNRFYVAFGAVPFDRFSNIFIQSIQFWLSAGLLITVLYIGYLVPL